MSQSDQLKTTMGEQEMFNSSFDPTFGVNAVEPLGFDGTALRRIKTDSDGNLQVDILSGGSAGGTEFDDGDAIDTTSQGTLLIGTTDVPGTARAVIVDDDGNLQVDVLTLPNVTLNEPISVDDNGSSLTVDGTVSISGTVAVTQSGLWDEVGINDSGNSITVDDGGSSLTVDGTVDTELTTADLDTGGGTDTRAVVGLVGSASGGGQLIPGSATDGLLVNLGANNDVTVTGSVTANAGTNLNTSLLALESGGNLASAAASLGVIDDWDNGASDGASVSGDVAHDGVDAGEPVKVGGKATDVGSTVTVANNDRVNAAFLRNGQQVVLAGDRATLTQNLQVTDADGAQTDTAIITVSAGTAIVVTKCSVTADNANSTDVSVRIGFGTANTPAADAAGVILFHPGIAAGSGVVEGTGAGIIGIGASNEDLRVTCEDPVGGSISIVVTYFTIAIG